MPEPMGKLDTVAVNGPEGRGPRLGRRGLAPRRGRCSAAAAATLHWACLSRLPGKRARPVLRGPRRGDASGLPDWVVRHQMVDDWQDPDTLVRDEEAIAACWAWEQDYMGMELVGTIHNEVRIDGPLDRPAPATVRVHEPVA